MRYEEPVMEILILEHYDVVTVSDGGEGPGGYGDGSDIFG